ncbi:hypothetical protein ANO11243_090160 [Dothideomycetidae sp. 11243]|nr:hypothetical protein ANO11243_090160 [fungal sp. No.11243]
MASSVPHTVPSAPQSPFQLRDKVAIVTGAGSGIGLAFAAQLLQAGARVVFADLALRPEAKALVEANAGRAVFVSTDVTVWDQLEGMFRRADEEFGGADLVCPGAGVYEPLWSNFWHPPGSAASRDDPHGSDAGGRGHYALLDLNVTHPIRVTQMAISRWLNPPEGSRTGKVSPLNPKRVVHIASVAGLGADLTSPLYHASKFAIVGFVRSMARLDALGIRVNAVAPALVRTPIWYEQEDKYKHTDPESGSWIGPDDVARAMVALATDDTWTGGLRGSMIRG